MKVQEMSSPLLRLTLVLLVVFTGVLAIVLPHCSRFQIWMIEQLVDFDEVVTTSVIEGVVAQLAHNIVQRRKGESNNQRTLLWHASNDAIYRAGRDQMEKRLGEKYERKISYALISRVERNLKEKVRVGLSDPDVLELLYHRAKYAFIEESRRQGIVPEVIKELRYISNFFDGDYIGLTLKITREYEELTRKFHEVESISYEEYRAAVDALFVGTDVTEFDVSIQQWVERRRKEGDQFRDGGGNALVAQWRNIIADMIFRLER